MSGIENRPAATSKLPLEKQIPPELVHIVNTLVKIGYNPHYKKDQDAIISCLSTAPLEQALPSNVKTVYDRAIGQPTPHFTCKLDDKTTVKVDTSPNQIVSIRHLKEDRKLFGIFRKFAIKNYFMVDKMTGKAWDVSQLWNDSEVVVKSPKGKRKPTQVNHLPDIFNAAYTMTDIGPNLILNRLSEHKNKSKIIKEIGEDGLEIVDNLIPIHESAHRVMFNRESSDDSLESLLIKQFFAQITLKFTEPIFRLAVAFGKWAGLEPDMALFKHYIVETERNAHAFYLNAVRRLKELGIDLHRNIPLQSIYKVINYTLGTYDKHSPVRFLPGLGYSQEVRKRQRLIKQQKVHSTSTHLVQHKSVSPAIAAA